MVIDNVNDATKAEGFIVAAGSMFPLGCAIPNNSVSGGSGLALKDDQLSTDDRQ